MLFEQKKEISKKEKINDLNYLINILKNNEVKFNIIVSIDDDIQLNISDSSSYNKKNIEDQKKKTKKDDKEA